MPLQAAQPTNNNSRQLFLDRYKGKNNTVNMLTWSADEQVSTVSVQSHEAISRADELILLLSVSSLILFFPHEIFSSLSQSIPFSLDVVIVVFLDV